MRRDKESGRPLWPGSTTVLGLTWDFSNWSYRPPPTRLRRASVLKRTCCSQVPKSCHSSSHLPRRQLPKRALVLPTVCYSQTPKCSYLSSRPP
ncbi:hypothetical protein BDV95DRAFT_572085 [Massariosphaeria phaeospora]|uniref:Uncharacterized protein n=1 Tax=Massariosphaeria phaeospora TaxID=100035 RepID=A0A7C8I5Q2_9PLEO|nr:hypothetical protein BDV95DRAFT_572085 [Massariosphaeria phaeospora]